MLREGCLFFFLFLKLLFNVLFYCKLKLTQWNIYYYDFFSLLAFSGWKKDNCDAFSHHFQPSDNSLLFVHITKYNLSLYCFCFHYCGNCTKANCFQDENRLQFPSGIKMRNGHIWTISTKFHNFITNQMDLYSANYRIMVAPVAVLTSGTSCHHPADDIVRIVEPNITYWPPKFIFLKWQWQPISFSIVICIVVVVIILLWNLFLLLTNDEHDTLTLTVKVVNQLKHQQQVILKFCWIYH